LVYLNLWSGIGTAVYLSELNVLLGLARKNRLEKIMGIRGENEKILFNHAWFHDNGGFNFNCNLGGLATR
jgi:hypothetical protein